MLLLLSLPLNLIIGNSLLNIECSAAEHATQPQIWVQINPSCILNNTPTKPSSHITVLLFLYSMEYRNSFLTAYNNTQNQ